MQAFRACEEIAPHVVRTFRSARHGRPEGLHYSDFFTGSEGLHYENSAACALAVVVLGGANARCARPAAKKPTNHA